MRQTLVFIETFNTILFINVWWSIDSNVMSNRDETFEGILRAANKHSSSRLLNLIRTVEAECSQRNIVVLLVEMAEHAEYSTDFGISLKYYLDRFDRLGIDEEIVLNEASLLLSNSSKIYARRVDYIFQLVEQQILTLSNADREISSANENDRKKTPAAEKPKRGRKRLVEACDDPLEIELQPKAFRKLTLERRFAIHPAALAAVEANRLVPQRAYETDQYIHPALYAQSAIVDLENEEEIDSKRNYKLFSYHVEHRYNTLRPDLDFAMHFMVKDYMDKENERIQDESAEPVRVWPPLSEEYVEKYVCLENQVLEEELGPLRKRLRATVITAPALEQGQKLAAIPCLDLSEMANDSALGNSILDSTFSSNEVQNKTQNTPEQVQSAHNDSAMNDSLMHASGKSMNETDGSCLNGTGNGTLSMRRNDSALGASIGELDDTQIDVDDDDEVSQGAATAIDIAPAADVIKIDVDTGESIELACDTIAKKMEAEDEAVINLGDIRIHLPHMNDDEEVRFSDLNSMQMRMLSPSCIATDVFPCMENKNDIVLIVDEEVKALNGMALFPCSTFQLPPALLPPLPTPRVAPTLDLNILQLPLQRFKRSTLFNPTAIIDMYLKARNLKRARTEVVREKRQFKILKMPTPQSPDNRAVVEEPADDVPRPWDFVTARNRRTSNVSSLEFNGFDDSDCHSDDEEFYGFSRPGTPDVVELEDEQADTNVILSPLTTDTVVPFVIKVECMADEQDAGIEVGTASNVACNGLETTLEAKEELLNEAAEAATTSVTSAAAPTEMESAATVVADNETDVVTIGVDNEDDDDDDADRQLSVELAASGIKTKIQQWHEHLQPILAKSRERHHFDVFQIGSEIIEELQTQKQNTQHSDDDAEGITFADVMQNKDKSFVSRNFLSTLLLASQGNIGIHAHNKSTEEPSEWSDIHLELLSTERHTVAIEDNIGMIATSTSAKSQFKTPTPATTTTLGDYNDNTQSPPSSTMICQHVAVNVNLSAVTPLKQIEKITREEDYDSGIYSSEELIS